MHLEAPEPKPQPAEVILSGRYLIDRELGRGGFGIVFLAYDLLLQRRRVVVKAPMAIEPHAVRAKRKFKAEIEALARIQHPGVVSVLDIGATTSGRPFFVMEYIPGRPLLDWLSGEPLAFQTTAEIIDQCGAALAAVHEHGICHRDLKPQNILISETGVRPQIKLIDFGVASQAGQQDTPSQSTQVTGTLAYMAPEQLLGQANAQSDIYSLAVISYEMLTGVVPFQAVTPGGLYQLQKDRTYVHPCQLRPELSPAAGALIEKGLSFHCRDRFGSVRDFTRGLASALVSKRPMASVVKPTEGLRLRITTRGAIAARLLHWMDV
jgi:eukaryotic-like serine/threonine-protein kinase